MSPQVHLLLENGVATERSVNGNAFREHADSMFATDGVPTHAVSDTDVRNTWQERRVLCSRHWVGVYVRPSLRLLYGVQVSNQNSVGNAFVETLDQYNDFDNVEQHVLRGGGGMVLMRVTMTLVVWFVTSLLAGCLHAPKHATTPEAWPLGLRVKLASLDERERCARSLSSVSKKHVSSEACGHHAC